ncbi:hypothetical protein MRX96_029115 [Rhipicephalus microplus]
MVGALPGYEALSAVANPLYTGEGLEEGNKKRIVFASRGDWNVRRSAPKTAFPRGLSIDWPWVLIKVAPDSKADREQFQRHLSLRCCTRVREAEDRESAKRMAQGRSTEHAGLPPPLFPHASSTEWSSLSSPAHPFAGSERTRLGELSWSAKREDTLD